MISQKRSEPRKVVYNFFAGFRPQAEGMYGWLRHEGLNPDWDFRPVGHIARTAITLPVSQLGRLRDLQKADPSRWGQAPRVA
ncbi:MAG: hypothetical protein EPN31_00875 [Castellaniella sp.]|uniref:hypothetical protein n=1 Tax=Castellaniella sp. TaxID=1955812 RepID=UPI00121AD01C|nr:hypothetical protein [Castellaniella sp.]TAN31024.1 MAG: hypothetical protein EPN31_00875 [Castellaniella sp.]